MNAKDLQQLIAKGESSTVEFKSWIKTKNTREIINLATKELVALTNANGGYVFLGVEDDGEITGCNNYDVQGLMESIYDRTRPAMYTEI